MRLGIIRNHTGCRSHWVTNEELFLFSSGCNKIALQSIFSHKLRSFLTLIGIIIGVASVVLVGASISGLNNYVLTRVNKELGANTFYITWAECRRRA